MSSSRADSHESLPNDSDEREEDGEDSTGSDTEEASETDVGKGEKYTEIKEQMYQDKLAMYNKQLQQLDDETHVDYVKRNKVLQSNDSDRRLIIQVQKVFLTEIIEKNFINEMKAAAKECEEKRAELRENLITEYDDKRRAVVEASDSQNWIFPEPADGRRPISEPHYETRTQHSNRVRASRRKGQNHYYANSNLERATMELVGDNNEAKPVMTRKLRRRPNDPLPMPEKRRKLPPAQINYLLDEKDIESDLKAIMGRGRPITPQIRRMPLPGGLGLPPINQNDSIHEPRIEDGKLRYEKRFYHRGQPIFVTDKETPRFAANIHNIGSDAVWVKKVSDASKVRISLSHLTKKKVHIERRVP